MCGFGEQIARFNHAEMHPDGLSINFPPNKRALFHTELPSENGSPGALGRRKVWGDSEGYKDVGGKKINRYGTAWKQRVKFYTMVKKSTKEMKRRGEKKKKGGGGEEKRGRKKKELRDKESAVFARCGGTGVGSRAVLRFGTFVRDKRRGGEPIGTDCFGKGKKKHHRTLRFSSLANQQHRCLQRGKELGLRVISDPHGNNNNSWLVVVCGFVWVLVGWGGVAWGVRGVIF